MIVVRWQTSSLLMKSFFFSQEKVTVAGFEGCSGRSMFGYFTGVARYLGEYRVTAGLERNRALAGEAEEYGRALV